MSYNGMKYGIITIYHSGWKFFYKHVRLESTVGETSLNRRMVKFVDDKLIPYGVPFYVELNNFLIISSDLEDTCIPLWEIETFDYYFTIDDVYKITHKYRDRYLAVARKGKWRSKWVKKGDPSIAGIEDLKGSSY